MAVLAVGGCFLAPDDGIREGTWVLATVDGNGPPFRLERITWGDGRVSTILIAYDTIFVTGKSTYTRAFRREQVSELPGIDPFVGSYSYRMDGTMTREGGTVVFQPPPAIGPSPLPPDTFLVGHGSLRRRVRVSQYSCAGTQPPCTAAFDRETDAVYRRQ